MEEQLKKIISRLNENNREITKMLTLQKEFLQKLIVDENVTGETKDEILKLYHQLSDNGNKVLSNDFEVEEEIRPTVGLLYGNKQKEYFYKILEYLKEFSLVNKIDIYCFNIDGLDMDKELVNSTFISGYQVAGGIYEIPHFIYNIACHSKFSSIKTMKQLRTMEQVKVINPVNRFNQMMIFDLISSLSNSDRILLPFSQLTPSILMDKLIKYGNLILLPERGILNYKGIIIEKDKNGLNSYCIKIGTKRQLCSEKDLFSYIKKIIRNKKYIVMKGAQLIHWNESPLEARVYVQKNTSDKWKVTQILAKNEMFAANSFYKNTRDDFNKVLDNINPKEAEEVERKIVNFSTNICTYLDHFIPDLGSCVLDYVIDENGNPYIVYFGGWDGDLDFIEDKVNFAAYLEQSLKYLLFLQNQKAEKGVENDLD